MFLSSLFRTFDEGYRPRSIFDEIDYMLPPSMPIWDTYSPFQVIPHFHLPAIDTRPKHWRSTIYLHGFKPEEVSTKLDEAPNTRQVLIHARHDDDEDFAEVRRTVQIPKEVDIDQVQVHFTKEGHLLFKAPFTQQELQRRAEEEDRDVLGKMNRIQHRINHLLDRNVGPASLGTSEIVPVDGGGEKFRADFVVADFKPEEVSVSQQGDRVVVEARHEVNTENTTSYKHMRREVSLPEGVQVDTMTSKLMEDGILRLEAPYVRPEQLTIEGRKIPVEVVKPQPIKEN